MLEEISKKFRKTYKKEMAEKIETDIKEFAELCLTQKMSSEELAKKISEYLVEAYFLVRGDEDIIVNTGTAINIDGKKVPAIMLIFKGRAK